LAGAQNGVTPRRDEGTKRMSDSDNLDVLFRQAWQAAYDEHNAPRHDRTTCLLDACRERGTKQGAMNEIIFTLPSLPPSMNALYSIRSSRGAGGRILHEIRLNDAARAWKTQAKECIPVFTLSRSSDGVCDVYLAVTFHYNLKHKNGKSKRKDAANYLKLVIDAVAERCGFDDSRVRAGSWATVHSVEERVEVVVREVTE